MTRVLVLCTANLCRSVMTEALLSARLTERGSPVTVHSAGLLGAGEPAPRDVIAAIAARGGDLSGHRSQVAQPGDLARADLVLGMAREHVRHAVVLLPAAWPRSFTLKELLRRGYDTGARTPGEPLDGWLARVGYGRDHQGLLGASPDDDVADPVGGPPQDYEATAALLDQLTTDLADLCWGPGSDC